jgi:hypothetical protein
MTKKIGRSAHAEAQDRYQRRKAETHKKICLWVPKNKLDAFVKSIASMKKKW